MYDENTTIKTYNFPIKVHVYKNAMEVSMFRELRQMASTSNALVKSFLTGFSGNHRGLQLFSSILSIRTSLRQLKKMLFNI